jgi:hypothetical protein
MAIRPLLISPSCLTIASTRNTVAAVTKPEYSPPSASREAEYLRSALLVAAVGDFIGSSAIVPFEIVQFVDLALELTLFPHSLDEVPEYPDNDESQEGKSIRE